MGGTFDPIHCGHLIMAESVMHSVQADGMLFVPAATHPFKSNAQLSDFSDRVAMTRMAIEDNRRFLLEMPPENSAYTIDLVDYLQNKYSQTKLFLAVGSDIIDEFHGWRKFEEIEQRIRIVIAARPGFRIRRRSDNILGGAEWIMIPQYDISSSDIRKRVERHQSITYMVPEAVEQFIYEKGLYGG
jgi:nicotinate-nucleotide adenylyltransferase